MRPDSPLVKYTQCEVYGDRERRGLRQTKEVLVTSERGCLLNGFLASMEQTRISTKAKAVSASETAPARRHHGDSIRYTIRVLECGNDSDVMIVDAVNDDRKGQPATQILPDKCSMRAEKIETMIRHHLRHIISCIIFKFLHNLCLPCASGAQKSAETT